MSCLKYKTPMIFTAIVVVFFSSSIISSSSDSRLIHELNKLPETVVSDFNQTLNKSAEVDTFLCNEDFHFGDIGYFWRCPHQTYNDEMYAMKFELNYYKKLSYIKMLLFDPEDTLVNYDSGFYVVIFDDYFGVPDNEIARFRVLAEDVAVYPDTFKLDLTDTNIFAGIPWWGTDQFYIAIQGVEGADGSVAIISDDGTYGGNVAFTYLSDPDNAWFHMEDVWGFNYNFYIIAEYCYYPKTVRVPEDYPTIIEARDHVSSYDTILVNDGVHDFGGTVHLISNNLYILSVNGPEHTILDNTNFRIYNGYYDDSQHFIEFEGFTMQNCSESAIDATTNFSLTIKNSVFLNNHSVSQGGAIHCGGLELYIENCTFYNNSTDDSGAVISIEGGHPTISNTIIANSPNSYSIESREFASSFPSYTITCSNFYGNELGDWTDRIENQAYINGNISEDPLFCDPDNGDLHISDMSFCNATHPLNSCGQQIGFYGVNCFGCDDNDIDAICNLNDNCLDIFNPLQIDSDSDDIGDLCDLCVDDPDNDSDVDGLCADFDNCPTIYNPLQEDIDNDNVGDVCDNCVDVYNPEQLDYDLDGIADACDDCTDFDNDGYGDPGYPMNSCSDDNCPLIPNPNQFDSDNDGLGDECDGCFDPDADGYGTPGELNPLCDEDNCPDINNPDQLNADTDVWGDACDNCRFAFNDNQSDVDLDAVGDSCDTCTDTDGDGYGDPGFPNNICFDDNCVSISNVDQIDSDFDGLGDACDSCLDRDFDGIGDPGIPNSLCGEDNCPDTYNPDQLDSDGDGIGDACCCTGIRGNIDYDIEDNIDIADLVYFVQYSFVVPVGPEPRCFNEADVNASGSIDIADIVYLVAYMFGGGATPLICP